jgi:hypothetical protein
VELFKGATEKDRRVAARVVVDWLKVQSKSTLIHRGNGLYTRNELLDAAEIAALAACSLAELKHLGHRAIPDDEIAYAVLEDRRPPWIEDWAKMVLEINPRHWPVVRRLVHEGICRRPDSDNYFLGLLEVNDAVFGRHQDVRNAMLQDPIFLKEDLWRLFEIEGGGEYSLANREKYAKPEKQWCTVLVQLATEQKLPRGRLLDASLEALERDFAQFRAGWFSRFHEMLQPTLDERVARVERYLRLLASHNSPTVSFALASLKILEKAKRLSAGSVVEHIEPALGARHKSTVLTALQLLGKAVRDKPGLERQTARVATTALSHESAEAQGAALDFIQRCGDVADAELVALVQEKAEFVAPSQRRRLIAWLGEEKPAAAHETQPVLDLQALLKRAAHLERSLARQAGVDAVAAAIRDGCGAVAALEFDGTEFPRLDPAMAIQPIQDLEELIDCFATTLENADDLDEVERVLDGVSRLCDQRRSDFGSRTGPLLKRATKLLERETFMGPFVGWGLPWDLIGLAISWITGTVLEPGKVERKGWRARSHCRYATTVGKWEGRSAVPGKQSPFDFLSKRVLYLARRAANGLAAPLLSAPTHRGGWIDSCVLVERAMRYPETLPEPDLHDQVLSLLRLAPEGRSTSLRQARTCSGEYSDALRFALGGETAKIGPTASLWAAAASVRAPFADAQAVEKRHPGLGPDAGLAARFGWKLVARRGVPAKLHYRDLIVERQPKSPARVASDMPTVLLHSQYPDGWHVELGCKVSWVSYIWPLARESFFAEGACRIAQNIDWWEAQWENRVYLVPLLDPDVPMKPMALLLLTLGLAAKEPGESGLATDALIAAIADARLDGPKLGEALGSLLSTGIVKATRWAKVLASAARVSPLHARVVCLAIQHSLTGDPAEASRNLLPLLELLKELLSEAGEPVSRSSSCRPSTTGRALGWLPENAAGEQWV